MLGLQRQIGNQATAALLAPPVAVQRNHTDDLRQPWEQLRGPVAVNQALTAATARRTFRYAPASCSDLPDSRGLNELADIIDTMDAGQRRYTIDHVGGESLHLLSELTGFVPAGRRLIGRLHGVAYVDPRHQYVMTTLDGFDIGPISFPVNILLVEYSNAYGWRWQRELIGST